MQGAAPRSGRPGRRSLAGSGAKGPQPGRRFFSRQDALAPSDQECPARRLLRPCQGSAARQHHHMALALRLNDIALGATLQTHNSGNWKPNETFTVEAIKSGTR